MGKGQPDMERGDVLRKPENQRFFVWTSGGLRLTGNPPKEVVDAWQALAGAHSKRPWLRWVRRAQM